MAKDLLGNTVQKGDKILYSNMICTVKEINENRIFGGKMVDKQRGMSLKIPDVLTLEIDIQYDSEKPLAFCVVKTPPEEKEYTA